MASSLNQAQDFHKGNPGEIQRYDAVIIGAGVTGLYSLYRMRELGFSVRAFDHAGTPRAFTPRGYADKRL